MRHIYILYINKCQSQNINIRNLHKKIEGVQLYILVEKYLNVIVVDFHVNVVNVEVIVT